MPQSLESEFVRDQLELRAVPLAKRAPVQGEYVLYWMGSTQRFEENWALRFATLEADQLGLPLLIHHGLDPTYPYASDRVHTFVLQGARELSARAQELGLTYRFALRRTRDDDRRVVDRMASRAALVVADHYPTAGVLERTLRFAERVACRVVMVDSVGVAPAAELPREQSAAFQMRARLLKGLDTHLEEVEDRAPRRAFRESVLTLLGVEIDHTVGAAAEVQGGLRAARARLEEFVGDGLDAYDERRREPSDEGGSSRLSRWLHFGMISSAEVVGAARAHAPPPALESFLNEIMVWRELSLNFCLRRTDYMKLRAAPDWAQKSMAAHKDDERAIIYSLKELEEGRTDSELWNASQQELVQSGTMHNAVRQLWGKSVILWTRRYGDALRTLLYLNDKYAIDSRDPNGFSGIQWCFGRFDRPFPERAVWARSVRCHSSAPARSTTRSRTSNGTGLSHDIVEEIVMHQLLAHTRQRASFPSAATTWRTALGAPVAFWPVRAMVSRAWMWRTARAATSSSSVTFFGNIVTAPRVLRSRRSERSLRRTRALESVRVIRAATRAAR